MLSIIKRKRDSADSSHKKIRKLQLCDFSDDLLQYVAKFLTQTDKKNLGCANKQLDYAIYTCELKQVSQEIDDVYHWKNIPILRPRLSWIKRVYFADTPVEEYDLTVFSNVEHLYIPKSGESTNTKVANFPGSVQGLWLKCILQNFAFNILPKGLKALQFDPGNYYTEQILPGTLPSELSSLYNVQMFYNITADIFPKTLKTLFLRTRGNFASPGCLPSNLQYLRIQVSSQPLSPNVIPQKVTELELTCYSFPIELGILPERLQILQFGDCFDEKLEPGVLPKTLEKIYFGCNFNQKLVPGVFPASLQTIKFDRMHGRFNHEIKIGVLPPNLQKLHLSKNYDHEFAPGCLPDSIEVLRFGDMYDQPFEEGVLPENLKYLHLGYFFNQDLDQENVPDEIELIHLGNMLYEGDIDPWLDEHVVVRETLD